MLSLTCWYKWIHYGIGRVTGWLICVYSHILLKSVGGRMSFCWERKSINTYKLNKKPIIERNIFSPRVQLPTRDAIQRKLLSQFRSSPECDAKIKNLAFTVDSRSGQSSVLVALIRSCALNSPNDGDTPSQEPVAKKRNSHPGFPIGELELSWICRRHRYGVGAAIHTITQRHIQRSARR